MGMSMSLSLATQQLCTICGCNIHSSKEEAVSLMLFGSAKLSAMIAQGYCPKCGHQTPAHQWTPAMQNELAKWIVAKLKAEVS